MTWEVYMQEPIAACFTLVQWPGREAAINGTLTFSEDGIECQQQWAFRVGDLADAETALQWLQMALARACDGV